MNSSVSKVFESPGFSHGRHLVRASHSNLRPSQEPDSPPIQFGHGSHGKKKSPLKLILWGLTDITLMAGSVFFADVLVPDPPSSTKSDSAVVAPDAPQKQSHWLRALELSGIATGLHLLSHVGLAGGWFLYGRHRATHRQDEKNKNFDTFRDYAEKLAKDDPGFKVIPNADGSFQVIPKPALETPAAQPSEPQSKTQETSPNQGV